MNYEVDKMKHMNKMIAPIVIGLILCIFLAIYMGVILAIGLNLLTFILGAGILALIGVVIAMVIQRIDEINGGEEDDISKY